VLIGHAWEQNETPVAAWLTDELVRRYPVSFHTHSPATSHDGRKGAGMGDKGGKKDKEKNKQQQLTKQKQEEQKKQDKARPKTP